VGALKEYGLSRGQASFEAVSTLKFHPGKMGRMAVGVCALRQEESADF